MLMSLSSIPRGVSVRARASANSSSLSVSCPRSMAAMSSVQSSYSRRNRARKISSRVWK